VGRARRRCRVRRRPGARGSGVGGGALNGGSGGAQAVAAAALLRWSPAAGTDGRPSSPVLLLLPRPRSGLWPGLASLSRSGGSGDARRLPTAVGARRFPQALGMVLCAAIYSRRLSVNTP